jgi:predicted RNA-binding Zn-ribbon protein involved in translation (DUF1610 family)
MERKLIKKWTDEGLRPSSFEFFTNRPDLIIGKLPGKDAEVEYICPKCQNYEIKTISMGKGVTKTGRQKKKFDRPEFDCTKCGNVIKVLELKKAGK